MTIEGLERMQYLDFGELGLKNKRTEENHNNSRQETPTDRPRAREAGDNATKDRGDVGRGPEQERGRGRRRLPPWEGPRVGTK